MTLIHFIQIIMLSTYTVSLLKISASYTIGLESYFIPPKNSSNDQI